MPTSSGRRSFAASSSRACRSARRRSPSSCRDKKKQDAAGYDYSLRPILFLVPRGAAPTAFEARKKEAESLRARFQNCDEGLRLAMALPDVAVRETITRQSVDLGAAAARRAQQHAGRPADAARCDLAGRRDVRGLQQDSGGRRRHARASARCATTMFQERYQALSKKYLKELRSQALIEIRQHRHDATAGADARRAGRDRSGHHARGLAAGAPSLRCRRSICSPIPDFLARRARMLGLDMPIRVVAPEDAAQAFAGALPVVALAERVTAEPGRPMPRARRPRSRRSAARSPTCSPAARMRSSPIRSPRRCSIAPASPSPATPSFSPGSRRSTPGAPRIR